MKKKTGKSGKTPWYKDGLRFQCRQCGGCCAIDDAYVWVEASDIKHLADYFGLSEKAFQRKYVKSVDGSTALLEGENSPCVLFENGRCSAYPARPFQCRSFPFWLENLVSPEHWREGTRICPGVNGGRLYTLEQIEQISTGCMDAEQDSSIHDDLKSIEPAALEEMGEVYRRLDEAVSLANVSCDSCGKCCRSGPEGPRLYCTRLEFAYMLKHGKAPYSRNRLPGACPHWNPRTQCTNRLGRAIGCRTYFCRGALLDLHEMALGDIKAISLRYGIPWDYKDLLSHVAAFEHPPKQASRG